MLQKTRTSCLMTFPHMRSTRRLIINDRGKKIAAPQRQRAECYRLFCQQALLYSFIFPARIVFFMPSVFLPLVKIQASQQANFA